MAVAVDDWMLQLGVDLRWALMAAHDVLPRMAIILALRS
jgi:hypothetical protein